MINIGALARDENHDSEGEHAEAQHDLKSPPRSFTSSRREILTKIRVAWVLLVTWLLGAVCAKFAVVAWLSRGATTLPKLELFHFAFPLHRLPATLVQNLQLKQVPTNIVIMAQVANPAVWPEMRVCISNVVAATSLTPNKRIIVRLHLAMTQRSEVVEADAMNMPGLREATIVMVKNRGADIGEFMQQLQLMRNKSADTDIILKIHSKTNSVWRKQMLCNLCGNPQQALTIINMFEAHSNLGIVGPPGLIFGADARPKETWGLVAEFAFIHGGIEEDMRRTWGVLFPNNSVPFPTRERYLISAGSYFWVRPDPLLSDEFQTAIPVFIKMFHDGYQRNDQLSAPNKHLYALERVIPTMIHGYFMLDYAVAPWVGLWHWVHPGDNVDTITDRPCQ